MHLHQITPFILCSTLASQVTFYQDILGFKLGYMADNYAFLKRDDVAVRLVEVDPDVDLSNPERQSSFYIDVHDIDELFLSLQDKLNHLPEGRVREPFNQVYGQREFHVADEDCTLIFFGEAISK